MEDYREISPGFWFPAGQGYTYHSKYGKGPPDSATRDLRMVKVQVNEPLDDELFKIEVKDDKPTAEPVPNLSQ